MPFYSARETVLRSSIITVLLACLLSSQALGESFVLIKAGTVVNHDHQEVADVLIRGERIEAVGPDLKAPRGARVIDAQGSYVVPGGIDPHTHLEMPFMGQVACDDFYSGQAAALAGGTTMHIDFALPIDHDLAAGFQAWREKGRKGCMDYSFHMAVTSWSDKVAADMAGLVAQGVNSFKFFMAYKGALMVTDEQLLHGFLHCKKLGALPQVHAENGDAIALWQQRVFGAGITGPEGHALSRPALLEGEATGRAITLARLANVPLYVVHVMSSDALDQVAAARKAGQRVIGEPVASGLAMDESCMWDANFTVAAGCVMSPPIRGAAHRRALRAALATDTLQLVATDHAVFNSTQKAVGRGDFRLIPNGVNGLEERMHIIWEEMVNSGLMSPQGFVRVTSTAAAQSFNLYPRKGRIAPGSDADIAVLDPRVVHTLSAATHHSRMDTNIYEGKQIRGKVTVTISRGRVVWEGGVLHVEPGTGRFLPLAPFGRLFEGVDAQDERALGLQFPYGPTPVARSAAGGTAHEEL